MNPVGVEGRVLIRRNFYVYAFDVIALQLVGDVHECQGQSDAARLAVSLATVDPCRASSVFSGPIRLGSRADDAMPVSLSVSEQDLGAVDSVAALAGHGRSAAFRSCVRFAVLNLDHGLINSWKEKQVIKISRFNMLETAIAGAGL